jgi:hypothetical protein
MIQIEHDGSTDSKLEGEVQKNPLTELQVDISSNAHAVNMSKKAKKSTTNEFENVHPFLK